MLYELTHTYSDTSKVPGLFVYNLLVDRAVILKSSLTSLGDIDDRGHA